MRQKYDFYEHRKFTIIFSICICFIIILTKLISIQLLNKEYILSANNNVIRKIIKYPERGWIYDRNNNLLVSNQRCHDIMVVPYQVEKNIDTLLFCDVFGISKSMFQKKMKRAKRFSNYKSSTFLENLSKEKFGDIQEKLHLFSGFYPQAKYIRNYNTSAAGNIFGYISQINLTTLRNNPDYHRNDLIGVSGIEKTYEKILKGEKGVERKTVDVHGRYKGLFNEGKHDTLAKKGLDIQISIDLTLQEYAENLMNNKKGSIVAIEPETGEVLCLVSSPNYDPNLLIGEKRNTNYRDLYLDPKKPLYDRSTSALYPPGSIFKLINALIALQEKQINSGTLVKCKKGWSYKSKLTIGCHEHNSPLNLRQSIAQSCNAYFCSTFQKIISSKKTSSEGLNSWSNYVKSFGIGKIFNDDLNNKKSGFVPNSDYYNDIYGKRRWASSTCISLGIGQDALLMTPVQMANLAAIIANKGYYITPHIIKKINYSNTQIPNEFYQKIYCNVDENYFSPIILGMQTAIEGKDGTAKSAKIEGITICGKTGTAQNPHGKDHSIFIAFAPKKNPIIAIAIYVENGGWGSEIAAPIGSLCIEKYIKGITNRGNLETKIINTKLNES